MFLFFNLCKKYERSYQSLQSLTAGLSDKETHDALTRAIVKDKGHEEMSLGLLVIILTEPKNATKVFLIYLKLLNILT